MKQPLRRLEAWFKFFSGLIGLLWAGNMWMVLLCNDNALRESDMQMISRQGGLALVLVRAVVFWVNSVMLGDWHGQGIFLRFPLKNVLCVCVCVLFVAACSS